MAIIARFDGTCAACSGPILTGQSIERVGAAGTSGLHFKHESCQSCHHVSQVTQSITPTLPHALNPYRNGTIAWYIATEFLAGNSPHNAFLNLRELRKAGHSSLVFSRNDRTAHVRVPLPDYRQDAKLQQAIKKYYKSMSLSASAPVASPQVPSEPEPVTVTVSAKPEDWLFQKIDEARKIADEREHDSIAYRPINEGAKMVRAGLDPMRVLDAMVKNWPDDARSRLGVENMPTLANGEALAWIKTLAELRIPIYLYGDAGLGKSTMAKQLAVEMFGSLDWYGECPMSAGASPSWLAGAWTVDAEEPFKTRDFLERYGSGGVFCFEEIDRADANLLTFLNNALAGEAFRNPVSGKTVMKSEKAVICATANTFGTGATTRYPSAEMLDFSTLDRFRMGRVKVDYDATLARSIWDNA